MIIQNDNTVSDFLLAGSSKIDSLVLIEEVVFSLPFGIKLEYDAETSFPWVARRSGIAGTISGDSDCWSSRDRDHCNSVSNLVTSKAKQLVYI